jgi:galactoside O-acetyltransferase
MLKTGFNPFDPGYYCSEELRTFGFASVGDDVLVSKDCTIIGLSNIHLGASCRIDSNACLIATRGKLILAGRNHIGGHSHLCATDDLTIGEFSGTSQGVRIYTATDDYSGDSLMGPCVPPEFTNYRVAPVTIGKHVSIGSGSVILPGCEIAEGAIVGALSLVLRNCAEWSVYHGNPARKVGERTRRALEMEARLDAPESAVA